MHHFDYIDGPSIEAVTLDPPAAAQSVIRYEHGLVMPGFVNLHGHCLRGGRPGSHPGRCQGRSAGVRPHLQPVWDPLKNLVWKGHAGDIALVMVHGETVMRDGKFLKADEDAIMRKAASAAKKIWDIGVERGILPVGGA